MGALTTREKIIRWNDVYFWKHVLDTVSLKRREDRHAQVADGADFLGLPSLAQPINHLEG